MDINALPVEIWCQIFEYLSVPIALRLCNLDGDVGVELRRIVLLCKYDEQKISSDTKYFLNCEKYEITDRLSFSSWRKEMFCWRNFTWINSMDVDWNIRRNLTAAFNNKSVSFRYRLYDFRAISACKEIIYDVTDEGTIPDSFLGVEVVSIRYSYTNRYVQNPEQLDAVDISNLRYSQHVLVSEARINKTGLKNFTEPLKSITLSDCYDLDDISQLNGTDEIDLSETKIRSISGITHVKHLNIAGTKVDDINSLVDIETLNASNTKITRFDAPSTLRHLDISDCRRLTTINLASTLDYLDISNTDISDISQFSKIKIIKMAHCSEVSDISLLTDVEYLDISCTNIRSVKHLNKLRILRANGCEKLVDVGDLPSLEDACLCELGITDVTGLSHAKKLTLQDCYNLQDVSSLGNVDDLDLSGCGSISKVDALVNVDKLNLSRCTGIRDFNLPWRNRQLMLIGLDIDNFEYFQGVRFLNCDLSGRSHYSRKWLYE